MQSSNTPTKIPQPFADAGTKNAIPATTSGVLTPNQASMDVGFPTITSLPPALGGLPPYREDFNGVLNAITKAIRWSQAGGHYKFDAAFATDANVGGYPKGALLLKADYKGLWLNAVENNTTNPDTGGAGWSPIPSVPFFMTSDQFGAKADGTDQTAAIQLGLNAIPAAGGTLYIREGVKFNLKALTFVQRFYLSYIVDDDISRAGMGFELGSGERVIFCAPSGFPADPDGGYVCEERLTGPIQPGYVVDARKDLTAAVPFLGPGQSLDNPVRMSYNGMDEQTDRFRLVGEYFNTFTKFSGWFLHGWQSATTLVGIGTQDFSVVPTEGDMLTGTLSSAKGFYLYSEGTAVSLSACRYLSTYTITTPGNTNWVAFGAANNTAGTSFIYSAAEPIEAGNFVIGKQYEIVAALDTDFTIIGAADNLVGTVFVATGDGAAATVPLGTPGVAEPTIGTGTCTGARKTVIAFQAGRFKVGDALIYPSGTTSATASSWVPASTRYQGLSQGAQGSGGLCVGDRPPGSGSESFNVAGNLVLVPTRGGSTIIPRRVTRPSLLFSGNPEAVSNHKLGITYNPRDNKDTIYRRLYSTRSDRGAGKKWCGEFVPVSAQINFTNVIAIGRQSVNIRKMTKVATGRYAFEFEYELSRSDYTFTFGKDIFYMVGWDVGLCFPTTKSCEVRVYNDTKALADIPAGAFVCMTLMGGDV